MAGGDLLRQGSALQQQLSVLLGKPLTERHELRGVPGLVFGARLVRDDAGGHPTDPRDLDGVDRPDFAGLFRASVLREKLVGGRELRDRRVRRMRDAPALEGYREDMLLLKVQIARPLRTLRDVPRIRILVALGLGRAPA